jgi:hypothetical protein
VRQCVSPSCGSDAAVMWQRRPNDAELAALHAVETANRELATLLADPENPPVHGPMPVREDYVVAVHACADHGISVDLATRIHGPGCSAPASACDCEPEALPERGQPSAMQPPRPLPVGW